jgi:hypothetical protein
LYHAHPDVPQRLEILDAIAIEFIEREVGEVLSVG